MKKFLSVIATSLLVCAPVTLTSSAAFANDPSTPSAAAPAGTTTGQLKDGTKVEINADTTVSIINADGTKSQAPDGIMTMKDGTSLVVKDGKKVEG